LSFYGEDTLHNVEPPRSFLCVATNEASKPRSPYSYGLTPLDDSRSVYIDHVANEQHAVVFVLHYVSQSRL